MKIGKMMRNKATCNWSSTIWNVKLLQPSSMFAKKCSVVIKCQLLIIK